MKRKDGTWDSFCRRLTPISKNELFGRGVTSSGWPEVKIIIFHPHQTFHRSPSLRKEGGSQRLDHPSTRTGVTEPSCTSEYIQVTPWTQGVVLFFGSKRLGSEERRPRGASGKRRKVGHMVDPDGQETLISLLYWGWIPSVNLCDRINFKTLARLTKPTLSTRLKETSLKVVGPFSSTVTLDARRR